MVEVGSGRRGHVGVEAATEGGGGAGEGFELLYILGAEEADVEGAGAGGGRAIRVPTEVREGG